MTLITGNVKDIGLDPLSGTLIATSVEFRVTGDIIIAPEARTYPIVGGIVSADLIPGPTRLTVQVGSHARESFDVIVPDEPVTLASLIEDAFEWTPSVVSAVAEHRAAAEQARDEAVAAAGDVDAAISGAADQVVAAVESDRVAAEAAAGAAASSASAADVSAGDASAAAGAAAQSASDAAGSASAAASSAGAASGAASSAEGSATDAAGAVTDARAARDAAEGHATSAAGSASAASQSAVAADGHADRAEAAADSFGLTATSSTLAPGASATVTVSGEGPAYSLSFGVPQGPEGPRGPAGSQEIGWTDDGTPYLLEPGTGEPGTQSGEIVAAGRPDISATMDAATQAAVNAASPGAMFRSTDGPQGAWMWRKNANGQWSVVDGDTGWRNVISTLESNGATGVSGRLRLKRTAGLVWVSADDVQVASGTVVLIPEPSFQIDADNSTYPGALYNLAGDRMQRLDTAQLRFNVTGSGCRLRDLRNYPNTKPWPTSLPGTPA